MISAAGFAETTPVLGEGPGIVSSSRYLLLCRIAVLTHIRADGQLRAFLLIGHCPQSSSASRFTAGACGLSNQASGRNDIGNLALRNDALQPELARAMEDYNKIGTNTKCQCALSMSGHWGEAGSNAAAR
jgi:hypothetical protein